MQVNEKQQYLLTNDDLNPLIDKFVKFHNFEKKIPLYKEVPVEITRAEVDGVNVQKSIINKEY